MSVRADQYGEVCLLRFDGLADEPDLIHAVTTRPQNHAPHRGTGREQAITARQEVCRILDVPFKKLTAPAQVHGGEVLPIEPGDVGRGRDGRDSAVPYVDGLMCDVPGVPMLLLSADCPIVCVYDPGRHAVGAVHASWRGTVARAAENLVRQMVRAYGCSPQRMRAAIAPSAGPDAYEVGPEVRRLAEGRLERPEACFRPRGDKWLLDLWTANRGQLDTAGVPGERIEIAGLCTITDQRFWSHRRDGADAGRFAVYLALR